MLISEIDGVGVVGHARDAAQSLQVIEETKPDVAILDVRLAAGSGLDVLRTIRSEGRTHPVAIMFTSQPESQMRRLCVRLGADYILSKARDIDRLADVLRSIVAGIASGPEGA